MPLRAGPYDELITTQLANALRDIDGDCYQIELLDPAESAERLAGHLHAVARRGVNWIASDALGARRDAANAMIDVLASHVAATTSDASRAIANESLPGGALELLKGVRPNRL